ncbi:hypothetical protein M433DRAFT_133254 [Acidomyces richmondensis BFW]|nr:hypothetical protein M433DRAFT_133254 [Acidomyces richmondensis BFW]
MLNGICEQPVSDIADPMLVQHFDSVFATDTNLMEMDGSSSLMLPVSTGSAYMQSPGSFLIDRTSMHTFLPDRPFDMHELYFHRTENESGVDLAVVSVVPSFGLSPAASSGKSYLSQNGPPPFFLPSDHLVDQLLCGSDCSNKEFEAYDHSSGLYFLPSWADDAIYTDQCAPVQTPKPIAQIDTNGPWYGHRDEWQPTLPAFFPGTPQHDEFQRGPADMLQQLPRISRDCKLSPNSHVAEYDAQMKYLAEKLRQARSRKHAIPKEVSLQSLELNIPQVSLLPSQMQNNEVNDPTSMSPQVTGFDATHPVNHGSQNTSHSTMPLQHTQQGCSRKRDVSVTQGVNYLKRACLKRKDSLGGDIASRKSDSYIGTYKTRAVAQMIALVSAHSPSMTKGQPSLPKSKSVAISNQMRKQILTRRVVSRRSEMKERSFKGTSQPIRDIYADPMHHTATGPRRIGEHMTGYGPEKAKIEPGIVLSLVPMVTLPFGGVIEISRHYIFD